jgi:hypothetical protein
MSVLGGNFHSHEYSVILFLTMGYRFIVLQKGMLGGQQVGDDLVASFLGNCTKEDN